MKKNKQENLIIQPIYSIVIWLVLLLAFIALLVFPNIFWKAYDQIIWKIVFNIFFSLMACFCVYAFLRFLQVANLSENGIIISCPVKKKLVIQWSEIKAISKEKLVTYNSRGFISLQWIIIRTDSAQTAEMGGINALKRGPWQIKATKKNLYIMKKFANEFAKHADIKLN